MIYGDESDATNTKFKEVVLPPGFLDDPDNKIMGIRKVAPDENPAESAPRSARRQIDPASGQETWKRTLRPRHRNVVRKYFDSRSK